MSLQISYLDDLRKTYSFGRCFSFALSLISSLILGRDGSINVKYLLMLINLTDDDESEVVVLLLLVGSFGLHKLRNWRQLFTHSRHSPIFFGGFQRKKLIVNLTGLRTIFCAWFLFPLKITNKNIFTALYLSFCLAFLSVSITNVIRFFKKIVFKKAFWNSDRTRDSPLDSLWNSIFLFQ